MQLKTKAPIKFLLFNAQPLDLNGFLNPKHVKFYCYKKKKKKSVKISFYTNQVQNWAFL